MEYTNEQLRAAYALNLCTVSVSQIIDYADAVIMDQEYEAILNNLNLEKMPKDDALLSILKEILDVISTFRLQEGDKKLLDEKYQQETKNALWSAVPNIGMIVAGGNPGTMAISLISQIGIGYMNYRRTKAEAQLGADLERWRLDKEAVKLFSNLRRELFDTAWRLADTYGFPDNLRLTEHQIQRYDSILMDSDLIRKMERLEVIRDEFLAYPPFWYYYGNTAHAIACSDLPISGEVRDRYRNDAKEAFLQYRKTNQNGLLREDPIASACALELIDLLDFQSDREQIRGLISEALRYSGGANDILQYAAISYLKLNELENAGILLRRLVNERYNEILNAQLLSVIYVDGLICGSIPDARSRYETLSMRVGKCYLFPMPEQLPVKEPDLDIEFRKVQKQILLRKYMLALHEFTGKYIEKCGAIIPPSEKTELDLRSRRKEDVIAYRKHVLRMVFLDPKRSKEYVAVLRETGIPFRIIDLLNELFEACCRLSFVGGEVQEKLAADIEEAITENQGFMNELQTKLNSGEFGYEDMCSLLDLDFQKMTGAFFQDLSDELMKFVMSREELQDFSLAEQNLVEFCNAEGLTDPTTLYGKDGDELTIPDTLNGKRFGYHLLGKETIQTSKELACIAEMTSVIRESIPGILIQGASSEFFTSDDARLDRYFNRLDKLKNHPVLKAQTLAVLEGDDFKSQDLIFTPYGIVPVRYGIPRSNVPYHEVKWNSWKKKELMVGSRFSRQDINMDALYDLIQKLRGTAKLLPESEEEDLPGTQD